jgi:hypothetical protein
MAAGHVMQDLEEALIGERIERQLCLLLANPHAISNVEEFTGQNPKQGTVTQEQLK